MGSEEADRKGEKEMGMTHNKGPWLESHQGRCSYAACAVTIWLLAALGANFSVQLRLFSGETAFLSFLLLGDKLFVYFSSKVLWFLVLCIF